MTVPMTDQEARIERECVEWVFGLTGGELETRPLNFTDDEGRARTWRYHFDGVPEWATSDFDVHGYFSVDYFTLVDIGVEYGCRGLHW